jgi:hypothetical protein
MADILACVRALGKGFAQLPGPGDHPVIVPPSLHAWSRRVPARTLWVVYRLDEGAVTALALLRSPRAPIE